MNRRIRRNAWLCGVAAFGLLGLAAGPSSAGLIIDLRVAGGPGNGKAVNVTAPGQIVPINVFGTITGANGNATSDEGLQSFYGSIISSLPGAGAPVGNMSTMSLANPFTSTQQGGLVQNLNGQPGLDVGSPNGDTAVVTDYVYGRAAAMATLAAPGGGTVTGSGDTITFLLGTVNYTVTALNAGGTAQINFVPRLSSTLAPQNTAALWREDGLNKNPTNATFGVGSPILATSPIPEPASIGLAGIAATGLLLRRRRVAAR